MTLLSKLFGKKKINEISSEEKNQEKIKWDGFDFFQHGIECYLDRRNEEALLFFDKAFNNNFINYFPNEAGKLYSMRAGCLQSLAYDYEAITDFDNAIALIPNDCNIYFSRSISKGAILDYDGQLADIIEAIEISKIDSDLNRAYNDEAQKKGYEQGVSNMFEISLIRAKMDLDTEMSQRKKISDAITTEDKLFWQNIYNERRLKRLSKIKRRDS